MTRTRQPYSRGNNQRIVSKVCFKKHPNVHFLSETDKPVSLVCTVVKPRLLPVFIRQEGTRMLGTERWGRRRGTDSTLCRESIDTATTCWEPECIQRLFTDKPLRRYPSPCYPHVARRKTSRNKYGAQRPRKSVYNTMCAQPSHILLETSLPSDTNTHTRHQGTRGHLFICAWHPAVHRHEDMNDAFDKHSASRKGHKAITYDSQASYKSHYSPV